MTGGEGDVRDQGSAIMNRAVQMTDALECSGSPPLSRPDRSSNRSGVARRTTCHPSASFVRRIPLQSFRHHALQIVVPLALSEGSETDD
jgi:hypothetical protein